MGKLNAQKNVNEMLTEPLPIVVVPVRGPDRRKELGAEVQNFTGALQGAQGGANDGRGTKKVSKNFHDFGLFWC